MTNTQFFQYLAAGFLTFGFGLFMYLMAKAPPELAPVVGLKGLKRSAVVAEGGLFVSIEPAMRWLAARISALPLEDVRERVNTRIRQAGEYLGLSADEYLALCVISAVGMLCMGVLIDALADIGSIYLIAFVGFGAIVPYMQIAGEIERRFKQVNRGLPHAIDLIALTMSAGLDFPGAIRQVTDKTADKTNALYEELLRILQELELGRTRKQALLGFADRCPTEAVRDFVSSVVQAEEKGNPLAEVLQIQATMLRMRRSVAAEESAARAGVLMMGPLMLVFCTIMIIILGPFVVNMVSGHGL